MFNYNYNGYSVGVCSGTLLFVGEGGGREAAEGEFFPKCTKGLAPDPKRDW